MQEEIDDQSRSGLISPERPRYFEGELLSANDFRDEQDYFRHKSRLHNRIWLGPGVVCGLSVVPRANDHGEGVRISAGMALDAWGREVVVPADVDIVPLRIGDGCQPSSASELSPSSAAHIAVCYNETPIDPAPNQLDGGDGAEARKVREAYCFRVATGVAPDVSTTVDPRIADLLSTRRFHEALCLLAAGQCPPVAADPCVVLANVKVGHDGSLTIDMCGPRGIVPTNQVLMKLAASMRPSA